MYMALVSFETYSEISHYGPNMGKTIPDCTALKISSPTYFNFLMNMEKQIFFRCSVKWLFLQVFG